jgi:hypothetical protein
MKKLILILMAFLPIALTAQVASTGTTVSSVNAVPCAAIGTGFAQDNTKIGLSELLAQYADDQSYSFFEVSEEMFKAFCELENADSSSIALFKKIKSVKMLERQRTQEEQEQLESGYQEDQMVDTGFYNDIINQLDVSGYIQLLKSRNSHSVALLLKKEFGPADNEFLLITERMIIDIRGDIMIKTIYQMEEMMQAVQQILPN